MRVLAHIVDFKSLFVTRNLEASVIKKNIKKVMINPYPNVYEILPVAW